MPKNMPDHISEDMPDKMPNRMSENISNKMPEDLPTRKYINIMVEIIRNKIINSIFDFLIFQNNFIK